MSFDIVAGVDRALASDRLAYVCLNWKFHPYRTAEGKGRARQRDTLQRNIAESS